MQRVLAAAFLPKRFPDFDLRRFDIRTTRRIAAPPFGEAARAEWLAARFRELGLEDVHLDGIGNVIGIRPGRQVQSEPKFLAVSAHLVVAASVPFCRSPTRQ